MHKRPMKQVWMTSWLALGVLSLGPVLNLGSTQVSGADRNTAQAQSPDADSGTRVITLGAEGGSHSDSTGTGESANPSASSARRLRTPNLSSPAKRSDATAAGQGSGDVDAVQTVELLDPGKTDSSSQQANVEVGSLGEVDMAVKDLDITKALQVLSIQSQKNIVASRNVSGTVTANLYGVDFYEALDAILHPNGYGYEQKGNMIYVYTQDEIDKRRKANRKIAHKVIQLDYITAADASTFVSPLLSPEGQISVSGDVEPGVQPSIGDAGANSSAYQGRLVVVDYEQNVDQILDLINELDTKPKQVLIEAKILQVRLTENNALGVDFAAFSDLQVEDFTSPLNAVDDLLAGQGADGSIDSGNAVQTSAGNVANGESGVKVGVLGSDASIFLRALDSVSDTNVLATPKILALNRQKAEIDVGDKLGYLSTTVTDTSQTQTVEFLDVGTQLTLRPFISSDDHIRMELRPNVSDGNTDRVVDGNVIPRETSQTLTTNVIVPNGQTIVLGGLYTEDTSVNTNQIPGLGQVPIVGWLGKGQDDTVRRSEVIFMVKPTIMKDTPLAKMGDETEDTAMRSIPGARKGLLPWSRTKLSAHYMKQAHQALENGNKDKAEWEANLALHVNPSMVDARRLKNELSGEELFYHNASMMDRAIDKVIDSQIGNIDDVEPDPNLDVDPSSNADGAEMNGQSTMDNHSSSADQSLMDGSSQDSMSGPASINPPASAKRQDPTHAKSVLNGKSLVNDQEAQHTAASGQAQSSAQTQSQAERAQLAPSHGTQASDMRPGDREASELQAGTSSASMSANGPTTADADESAAAASDETLASPAEPRTPDSPDVVDASDASGSSEGDGPTSLSLSNASTSAPSVNVANSAADQMRSNERVDQAEPAASVTRVRPTLADAAVKDQTSSDNAKAALESSSASTQANDDDATSGLVVVDVPANESDTPNQAAFADSSSDPTNDGQAAFETKVPARVSSSMGNAQLTYSVWSRVPWFAAWTSADAAINAPSNSNSVDIEFSQVQTNHSGQ